MGITREEQETIITYDRAGQSMNVYTADPFLMARLDKLPDVYKKVRVQKQGGVVVSAEYEADKALVTLRTKKPAIRKMSDGEKREVAERLAKARGQKSILSKDSTDRDRA